MALLKGTQANLAFLTTATGVKHQCLLHHHLEEFSLTILDQSAGHYALLGLGNTAHPVSVDTTVLFDVEDKRVPGLAYLQDLDTEDKVNTNPPTTGPNAVPQTEEALHSTILLPPWLTKEIEAAEVTSFIDLFLFIHKKAHGQD
eukprot:4636490-Ditylum_brightwellii.AAC.1